MQMPSKTPSSAPGNSRPENNVRRHPRRTAVRPWEVGAEFSGTSAASLVRSSDGIASGDIPEPLVQASVVDREPMDETDRQRRYREDAQVLGKIGAVLARVELPVAGAYVVGGAFGLVAGQT